MSHNVLPLPENELIAAISLEPSGNHQLELDAKGFPLPISFSISQAKFLQKAIDQFLSECTFEDARDFHRERQYRKRKALISMGEG